MGCGSSPEVIDKKEKNLSSFISSQVIGNRLDISDIGEDLMPILFLKISNLITNNPFYKISLSDFENTINILKFKLNNEQILDIKKIIEEITYKYLQNEENFVKILFKDIVNYAYFKFKYIVSDNNDIIFLILYFLYIFLSNKQPGKKKLFKEKIKLLLNKAVDDLNKKNQFKLPKLFNILINFVQMLTFSFGSFFVFFGLLDNFNNYNKEKFEEIINKKNSLINEVESIINNNLNIINEKISPYFLNLLVISELNNKIKFIFEKVSENEEFIILQDYEINIIADSLFESININNYIEYLFFGENHDY